MSDNGTKALAGTAALASIATLIASLSKPAQAAPAEGGVPQIVVASLDDETRKALSLILEYTFKSSQKLDTVNESLKAILSALGAPAAKRMVLEPFQLDSKTLQSNTPYTIYERTGEAGALIWAVVDISSPYGILAIRIDELVWDFEITKLRDQGVDAPLPVGVWLSKYDTANSHFCLIFSGGSVGGFAFDQRLLITIKYTGTGTATLNQGRGIAWVEA
jgi:hypothetical protein